jgi:putative transposase
LRELAFTRVRYGYRRLTVLLQREGWKVGKKRVLRLYPIRKPSGENEATEETYLAPACGTGSVSAPNQRWSIDFMSERLENGRYFRILTVIDQYSRECPLLWADLSLTGAKGRLPRGPRGNAGLAVGNHLGQWLGVL